MPCHTKMKIAYLQGLLWLYLFGFAWIVTALEPGFLDFDNLPDTNFSCVGKVIGGYYADLETSCQMFHVCTIGQLDEPMDIRFLCLNGTVFDQETRVCERIDEVDCTKSEQFYSLNLELYGNTQPPLLEDSSVSDAPIVKPSSTTTTTTTTRRPATKPTRTSYRSTLPPVTPTLRSTSKVISSHHFPVGNAPDIRFNPSEINIRLNPPSPTIIRPKQNYPSPSFSVSEVITHSNEYVPPAPTAPAYQRQTTLKPKSVVNYDFAYTKNAAPATPSDINYEFSYHQTEAVMQYHQTEAPQRYQYPSSTYQYQHPTTKRAYVNHKPTTYRSHSYRPHLSYQRTDTPHREQIPLPLLPTLPPLMFSTPAPFSLPRHKEAKRYTNEHQPRIIISASASVSDASGRRLNYSLGSIDTSHLLDDAPTSYDEYKESDVVLDPFYHDVPKIKPARTKRDAQEKMKHSDIIRSEQEAVDVLKFLFDWYTNQETTTKISSPVSPEIITQINEELAPHHDSGITDVNFVDEFVQSETSKNIEEVSAPELEKPVYSTEQSPNVDTSSLEETSVEVPSESLLPPLAVETLAVVEEVPTNNGNASSKQTSKTHLLQETSVPASFEIINQSAGISTLVVQRPNKESVVEDSHGQFNQETTTIWRQQLPERVQPFSTDSSTEISFQTQASLEVIQNLPSTDSYNQSDFDKPVVNKKLESEKLVEYEPKIEFSRNETERSSFYPSLSEIVDRNETRRLEKEETLKNLTLLILDYVDDNYEPLTYHGPSDDMGVVDDNYEPSTYHDPVFDVVAEDAMNETNKSTSTTFRVSGKAEEKYIPGENGLKGHSKKAGEETKNSTFEVPFSIFEDGLMISPEINPTHQSSQNVRESSHPLENSTKTTNGSEKSVTLNVENTTKNYKHSQSQKNQPSVEDFLNFEVRADESKMEQTTENTSTTSTTTSSRRRGRNKFKIIESTNESKRTTSTESLNLRNRRRRPTKPVHIEEVHHKLNPLEELPYIVTEINVQESNEEIRTGTATVLSVERPANNDRLVPELNSTDWDVLKSAQIETTPVKSPAVIEFTTSSQSSNSETTTSAEQTSVKVPETTANPSAELEEVNTTTTREQTELSNFPNDMANTSQFFMVTPTEPFARTDNNELSSFKTPNISKSTTPSNQEQTQFHSNLEIDGLKISTVQTLSLQEEHPSTEYVEKTTNPVKLEKPSTVRVAGEIQNSLKTSTVQTITVQEVVDVPIDVPKRRRTSHRRIGRVQSTTEATTIPLTEVREKQTGNEVSEKIRSAQRPQRRRPKSRFNQTNPASIGKDKINAFENEPTYGKSAQRREDSPPLMQKEENSVSSDFKEIHPQVSTTEFETTTWSTTTEDKNLVKELQDSDSSTPFPGLQVLQLLYESTTHLPEQPQPKHESVENVYQTTTGSETTTDLSDALKNFAKYFTPSTNKPIVNTSYQSATPSPTTSQITSVGDTTTESFETTSLNTPTTQSQLQEFIQNIETTTKSVMVSNLSNAFIEDVRKGTDEIMISLDESTEAVVTTTFSPTAGSVTTTGAYSTERASVGTEVPLVKRRKNSSGRTSNHRFSPDRKKKIPVRAEDHEIVDTASSYVKTSSLNQLDREPKEEVKSTTELPTTDAYLSKSANPTQPKSSKDGWATTPISKFYKVQVRKERVGKNYVFNCFGRKINYFYSDPRDCRLFHYCTSGFTKNQLLDMKFVCDLGTYFDDERLICTTVVPSRCE